MGGFDRILSMITTAAVIGLIILNYKGSTAVIQATSAATVDYISAIQGRGFPNAVPTRQGAYPNV